MKTQIVLLLFMIAVTIPASAQTAKFTWLTGTWKLEGKNTYEVWVPGESEHILIGKSYGVKGADTVVTENIVLKYFDGHFHYIPDVAGDQPPVDFKITSSDQYSFVAENPHHDFPKLIRYHFIRKEGNDFLEASIEGDGKKISYAFKKIK